MPAVITRKDSPAWKRLAARKGLARTVDVGVLSTAGPHPGAKGLSVAEVAAINHEGTDTIPARKFISVPLDGRTAEVRRLTERVAKAILEGRDPDPILNAYGQWAVNRVRAAINARMYAPNAERTVAAKGSDLPLVDTGVLKAAITYALTEGLKDG